MRFWDSTSNESGYKDLSGRIRIPAKFSAPTQADTFYNIIAVNEKVDSFYKSYYLLKNGTKVGKDSVFMFDFTFDCESDGMILYEDHKKDRVGFFDKNGVAVIPAIYNAASSFRNGLALALRNAKRSCWGEDEDTLNCEHLSWKGGEVILIDKHNNILVDSFVADAANFNWYSLRVNDPSVDTSIYVSIKGRQGNVYSFMDYMKEFTKWFYGDFLPSLSNENRLKKNCVDKIIYSVGSESVSLYKGEFFKKFPYVLTLKRFAPSPTKHVSLSWRTTELDPHLNNCNELTPDKYPPFDVMLTYFKKRAKKLTNVDGAEFYKEYQIDYQEYFGFLRTKHGYKFQTTSPSRKE